jgi:DNA-binding CsgD family transcriptional regulator
VSDGKTTVRAQPRSDLPERCQLRVVRGGSTGKVLALEPGEYVIGRGTDAQLRLDDSGVSRRHAKIVVGIDAFAVVVDLGSTNGTLVNSARVESSPLRPGYSVGIGPDAELVVERRDATTPAAPELTPRELEVARLVAAGHTNTEIAELLNIGRRTVATHLERIYRRLDIGSRAELARRLAEVGLA